MRTIDPEVARQLLKEFRKTANFFSLKNEYRAGVTEQPNILPGS